MEIANDSHGFGGGLGEGIHGWKEKKRKKICVVCLHISEKVILYEKYEISRTTCAMIHFSDAKAQAFWESDGRDSRPYSGYARVLMRKLRMMDAAKELSDLRVPPGNRLEALHGDRDGQYSIRVNDQFRICFVWSSEGVRNVEVVDYH